MHATKALVFWLYTYNGCSGKRLLKAVCRREIREVVLGLLFGEASEKMSEIKKGEAIKPPPSLGPLAD